METTPRCRLAINYAAESLSHLGHSHVSSAHLILGLLMLHGGVADNVLHRFGFSVESVENYLSSQRNLTESNASQEGVALGSSARLALERAEANARARQHSYLGTEHLLLGVLAEKSGEATDLFAAAYVDPEQVRWILEEELGPAQPSS